MSFSSFLTLNDTESDLLLQSVDKLTSKLEFLVDRFYDLFLESSKEISRLFIDTDMVKQHTMFKVAIGLVITNIEDHAQLQNHLDHLIDRHLLYGVKMDHIQYFTKALTKTIIEIFGSSDPVMKMWLKVIDSIMEYFKSKLL